MIYSEEGPQQGDPMGPLMFSLAIHPILETMKSSLIIGYLDDLTAGVNSKPSFQTISHSREWLVRWV